MVIADDGSDHKTKDLIDAFRNFINQPVIHVWHEDCGFRKCAILNKAILSASSEYLIFTDGDCVPRRDFVAAHIRNAKPRSFLSGTYCKLPRETSVILSKEDIVSGNAFTLRWLKEHGYDAKRHMSKIYAAAWGIDAALNALSPSTARFNGNNSSCWRSDAIRAGGFDERMGYGSEDHEFGYRLSNAGVKPRHVRYSAFCLHLDHEHGYSDPKIQEANSAIVQQTVRQRHTFTQFGLSSPANK